MHQSGGSFLQNVISWGDVVISFMLGVVFGVLRALQAFLDKPRPPFEGWIMAIKAVTAGGAGVLTGVLCSEYDVGANLGFVAVSLAGWGGSEFINELKDGIRDRLTRKLSEKDTPNA